MKRLVWLVLAAFCAALGQVQAVDTLGAKAKNCACCHPKSCGMPGCCPPPSSASQVFEEAPTAEVARRPSPRQVHLTRESAQGFYFSIAALSEATRQRNSPAADRAFAAIVPLYAAHCSFLI